VLVFAPCALNSRWFFQVVQNVPYLNNRQKNFFFCTKNWESYQNLIPFVCLDFIFSVKYLNLKLPDSEKMYVDELSLVYILV